MKAGDSPEMLNSGYMLAIDGCSRQALSDAVKAIIAGQAKGISKAFCPRPPELGALVREKQAEIGKLVDRENHAARMEAIEDQRARPAKRSTILDHIEAARRQMREEGRALLFKVSDHAGYLSRRKEIPAGGTYVACLGEAYGPKVAVSNAEGDDEGLPLHP